MDKIQIRNGFQVWRSTNGALPSQIGNVTAGAKLYYNDFTVAIGSTYAYTVKAISSAGVSAASNALSVAIAVPAVPTGLTASVVRTSSTTDTVTLTWLPASGANSYTVDVAMDAGFTRVITFSNLSRTTFATTVPIGTVGITSFYCRVTAVNALGKSAPSTVLRVFTK
jgi:predicted phage tail protein